MSVKQAARDLNRLLCLAVAPISQILQCSQSDVRALVRQQPLPQFGLVVMRQNLGRGNGLDAEALQVIRFATGSWQKIGQLAPELHQKLAAAGTNRAAGATFSNLTRIPASTVTDPIDNGIQAILKNRGVTAEDAQAAIKELQAMKQAALKIPAVPGATAKAWAPLEANALKQEIGQSTNWAGRERVGELVEPIKKQIYGNLKNSVNAAAPGTATLNERLTNLLAAQSDVNKLAGFEEVGRGRSMGGVIGPSWMGRIEALAGRFVPAASWLTPAVSPAIKTAIPAVTQSGQGTRLSDIFEDQ